MEICYQSPNFYISIKVFLMLKKTCFTFIAPEILYYERLYYVFTSIKVRTKPIFNKDDTLTSEKKILFYF